MLKRWPSIVDVTCRNYGRSRHLRWHTEQRLARAPLRPIQRRTDPDCSTRTYPAVAGERIHCVAALPREEWHWSMQGECRHLQRGNRQVLGLGSGHCGVHGRDMEPMRGAPGSDTVNARMKPRRAASVSSEHQRPGGREAGNIHLEDGGTYILCTALRAVAIGPGRGRARKRWVIGLVGRSATNGQGIEMSRKGTSRTPVMQRTI